MRYFLNPKTSRRKYRIYYYSAFYLFLIYILLVSAKHVFVTNYIDFGNRQAPFFKSVNGCPLKNNPSYDINLTMNGCICFFEAHFVAFTTKMASYTSRGRGCSMDTPPKGAKE